MSKKPVRVAVTGAAGQIGYALLFRIASGEMLGKDQPVILQLLEIPDEKAQKALKGVMMELEDCAFPLLVGMEAHADPMTAFKDTDYALLVGFASPRSLAWSAPSCSSNQRRHLHRPGQGPERRRFSRDVKVLVVGNPANTNAYIAMKAAPDLQARQLHRHAASGPQPRRQPAGRQDRQGRVLDQEAGRVGQPTRPPCMPTTVSPPSTALRSRT